MGVIRWVVRIVAVVIALSVLVFMGARMHDGPLGPIPGGALEAGELVSGPVPSWSFVKDVGEIELQLDSQSSSRTTWIFVLGDQAYVPCSLGYPPGKRWHLDAAADGRAVLRIEGKR